MSQTGGSVATMSRSGNLKCDVILVNQDGIHQRVAGRRITVPSASRDGLEFLQSAELAPGAVKEHGGRTENSGVGVEYIEG